MCRADAPEDEAVVVRALRAGLGPGWQAEILAGRDCTRDRALALLEEAEVLHVYAHGRFCPEDPRASCLVLAGGERLSLADLQQRDIRLSRLKLVTLAACETGVVEGAQLPEEALGLAAGFLQLGARAVVSALWEVPAAATAFLFDAFYRHEAAADDPARALQHARQAVRGLTRAAIAAHPLAALWQQPGPPDARPFASPYFWAGFVAQG